MRFLGVDYGTKRIGVAISDEGGTLAFPKEIVPNDANVHKRLAEVIKEEDISEIVVGESANFAGLPNALSEGIEIFIGELKTQFEIPVHKQKEFLTSVEARRYKNPGNSGGNSVDASAAALILQRYLDKTNNKK